MEDTSTYETTTLFLVWQQQAVELAVHSTSRLEEDSHCKTTNEKSRIQLLEERFHLYH